MVPHPCYKLKYGTHLLFSTHMFTEFDYFCLFLPIFRLKWYPILVINSNIVPICCFSTHMIMDSAYFPPMFCSFFAYFPPYSHFLLVLSCQETHFNAINQSLDYNFPSVLKFNGRQCRKRSSCNYEICQSIYKISNFYSFIHI